MTFHKGIIQLTLYNDFIGLVAKVLASTADSVQFSCSVVSDSCDSMDCSMPGLPVHHQLPEFTQTHVH